jgi:phosphotransferase system HPr (HPr) family protein
MYRRLVRLTGDGGLHVRPATLLMEAAKRFQSSVRVHKEGQTADGKSAISLMLLEAEGGAELHVEADGVDEVAAVTSLVHLIESRFGDTLT